MGSEKKRKEINFSNEHNQQSAESKSKSGVNLTLRSQKAADYEGKDLDKRTCSQENKTEYKSSPLLLNYTTATFNRALGHVNSSLTSKFQKSVIINHLKRFREYFRLSAFERRITSMSWHPQYPQVFVAASKYGDIIYGSSKSFLRHNGAGVGSSILSIKYSDKDPYTIFTASMLGIISSTNLQLHKTNRLFVCESPGGNNWFTSLDICHDRQLLVFGDCSGKLCLVTTSGDRVWVDKKIHGSKITHCEFNAKDPNIFVTASVDHTVKLWDIRSMSQVKLEPLMIFPHLKGVNSAVFSPSNGHNLLTTDQHSQLRVYSSPCWNETLVITHQHRHFQHLAPIKAQWHPLEDIIIVGRYPDYNILNDYARTVDFFDGSNGNLLHRITSPTERIISLCAMNPTGDTLALAAGLHMVWLKDRRMVN